jgi:hypothetical protein|tara:strand:- start:227 stop:505 length:279 start_codon:yes stop_codon:yes gene_type:complete
MMGTKTKRTKHVFPGPYDELPLEEYHQDAQGKHYLTLLAGEGSSNPLSIDFFQVRTPVGQQSLCLIVDQRSHDSVMVPRQILEDILRDGWRA